jgi:hypothetical protein
MGFWEALQLAFKILGWIVAASSEPVGAEIPVDDPKLTYGGKVFELAGAGGVGLVIKRLA